MSDFTKQPAQQLVPPDPTKHVNYTLGMVLGVDDFVQEFAYLSGRDKWIVRDLIGYGTVWGLKISQEVTQTDTRIAVAPGVAVCPSGQLIRVCPAQCASVNNWLRSRQTDVQSHLVAASSPPGDTVALYIVLCYRACPTDEVPIPGEPCRTEDESRAASRWKDDFELELRFAPPRQCEEEAIRAFVAWLAQQIEITDQPGEFITLDSLLQTIRDSAPAAASPPSCATDFSSISPAGSLRIHPAEATEYLRAIIRLWVTELRPRWHRDLFLDVPSCGCVTSPPEPCTTEDENCVLLAELTVPVNGDGTFRQSAPVVIHEKHRPCLGDLRLLQEWLLAGPGASQSSSAISVQHSVGLGSYAIVAAGVMKGTGVPASTTYNNLKSVSFPGPGKIKLSFDGYNQADTYVIKVTPMYSDNQATLINRAVTVSLVDPLEMDGFVLRVTDGTGKAIVDPPGPSTSTPFSGLQFIIEVSQYSA